MSFQAVSCLCLVFFAANTLAAITRIVGGREATINEFPFQVSLRLNGKHFCGGSIIGEQHILTAAHCVRGIVQAPYTNLAVHTGSTFSIGNLGKSYKVKRADVHQGYVGSAAASYHNDIAVLTLTDKIAFDEVTRKIELPSKDVQLGEQATVSGWGIRKYPSSDTSAFLQKASMKIVPSGSCAQYLHPQRLHREQVCAIQRKGVGACSGDSGGPLAANNEVIGIASWVVPCGEGYPDVYTKVYAYKDWLKGVMAKA